MADNTIDTLAIEVSGDVSSASRSINDLNEKLKRLDTAMGKNISSFRHFASSIGTVNSAVQSLNNINFGKINSVVTSLERLSKIDLSNIHDKSINVDIKLNSADAASNLKYSVEKSLDATKIDASALSRQLSSAFELKGGAASKLQRQIDLLAQQLTDSFNGRNFQTGEWGKTLDDIGKTIIQSGNVVKSNLGSYLSGAEQEWQDFYNYFKNKKIYVSDMLKLDIGKGEFKELLQSYLGNITTDVAKGINLNSAWSELSDRFPTLIPKETVNDADQLITVLENLKKTRDAIKPVSIQSLFGSEAEQASNQVYSSVSEMGTQLGTAIQKNIASALQSANGQIPIDVKINEDKITRDIRNAINKASTLNYDPVKVNLSVNTDEIKSNVESKLNGLDLSNVNGQLSQFTQAMSQLNSLNLKDSGLNSFINAIRRLDETLNASGDISGKISTMISEISTLSNIPDVSNNVNRFVSSLAKLANAGASIGNVNSNLEGLGEKLKGVIGKISGIGNISAPVNTFVQSISQLANAGNKTGKTAEQLGKLAESLKSFFQTMSSAPRISSNTLKMTQALAQLSNSGGNAEKAARSTSNAFSRLENGASGAVSKVKRLGNAIGDVNTKTKKTLPNIMSLAAKFWTLRFVTSKLWGSIEKSMNFLEDYNYFQAAFQQVADKAGDNWKEAGYNSAEEYAESFSKRARELTSKMSGFDVSDTGTLTANKSGKSLGMDLSLLLNYQATFAQISSSMGNTSEQAEKLSRALTMIGADLASVKNLDFKTVYENMSSGLVGMSRAVDKYGANIRVANLQQMATNLGIQTSVSKMDQASKAMLRTIVILDSTRYAWADMANTINMPANQLRILQSNLVACARALGNIFLPIVAKVLPYINGLVIAFQRLLTYIGGLLGVNDKIGSMFSGIGGNSDNVSNALDSLEDTDLSGVESATDDTNKNLKDATKNAKKLKQFLASYDELEVMSKDDSSLSNLASSKIKAPAIDTSAIDSGILNAALDKLLDEYQKKWDAAYNSMENKAMAFANKVTDTFKKLAKAAEPTTKALKNLWNNGLKQFRNFTWTALKDFWKHFLKPLGKWTLGEKGLPRLINAFNDFLEKINWDKINASLRKLWDALEPFAENVGTGLLDFFDDFFDKAGDAVNKLPDLIDKFTAFIKTFSPEQAQSIGYFLGQLLTAFMAFKGLTWFGSIFGKNGVIGKGFAMLAAHPYAAIAAGLGLTVAALDKFGVIDVDWSGIWDRISRLKDVIVDFIKNIDWDFLVKTIGDVWDVFQPFAEGFADAFINFFDIMANGIGAPLINSLALALDAIAKAIGSFDADQIKAFGHAIADLVIIAGISKFALKIVKLASSIKGLGTSLAGGAITSKILSFAGALKTLSAIGLGGILGLKATEVTVDSDGVEQDFEKLSNDTASAVTQMSNTLNDLNERGVITTQTFDSLSEKLNSLSGENTTTVFTNMRDAIVNAGISSDELAVSINNTNSDLESFYNIVAHASDGASSAGEQIKSFAEAVRQTNPDPLVDKLYSLQTAEEQITFADLIVESANAIDQMGGIWEDGKQILGDKAIAIYRAIQNGLKPDENGFYNLGEGQMVQFGKAIDDYDSTLKGKVSSTLSEPLQLAITEILPQYSTLGSDANGWFITGLTGATGASALKVQEAFKSVLDDIDITSASDIGEETGKNITRGMSKGIEETSKDVNTAVSDTMENDVKGVAADAVESHSPSKWFEELAIFCGRGFREGLDTGFASTFHWFSKLSVRINNSIGSLRNIGWNAIIGMNNGMVEAADQHLYKNAQTIAQNVANIFRKTLKINSPSKVFTEIGGYTMEGFQIGMQNMLPSLQSTIGDISTSIQDIQLPQMEANIKPVPSARMNQRPVSATGTFGDDIRREVIAISNNTFDNNQNIAQVIREAVKGMAVYADGHIIGYLQEENQQFRNRNGFGLFEG